MKILPLFQFISYIFLLLSDPLIRLFVFPFLFLFVLRSNRLFRARHAHISFFFRQSGGRQRKFYIKVRIKIDPRLLILPSNNSDIYSERDHTSHFQGVCYLDLKAT